MTATLADPVSEVVHAAEALLTRRTGATVTLTDPVDLGGSGRSVVVRVRVAANPFSLPRTLVLKQVPPSRGTGHVDFRGSETDEQIAFLREAVSYQFTTALAKDHRPGAELLAYDFDARLLVLSDLGDATTLSEVLRNSSEAAGNTLMALAQALGRMHAATVGREEDFAALLRRAVEAPLRQIVANAGGEPSVVVDKVKQGSGNYGFNAASDTYGDMIEMGILDPAKVTRSALQAAASIGGLMVTTEAMVAEIVEDKPAPAMPDMGGMGGMGGMM